MVTFYPLDGEVSKSIFGLVGKKKSMFIVLCIPPTTLSTLPSHLFTHRPNPIVLHRLVHVHKWDPLVLHVCFLTFSVFALSIDCDLASQVVSEQSVVPLVSRPSILVEVVERVGIYNLLPYGTTHHHVCLAVVGNLSGLVIESVTDHLESAISHLRNILDGDTGGHCLSVCLSVLLAVLLFFTTANQNQFLFV